MSCLCLCSECPLLSIERVYMIEFKLVQCRFVSEQWDSVGELFRGLQQICHRGHSLPHHVQVSTQSFLKIERNFNYIAIQSLESVNADPLVGKIPSKSYICSNVLLNS